MTPLRRQAYASLRLVGEDLDPSVVTRLLQLPPDTTIRRGDLRVTRTQKGKVLVEGAALEGVWGMSSQGWVDGSNRHPPALAPRPGRAEACGAPGDPGRRGDG